MRDCGILLHVSSLPGKGGCGTMGNNARRFVEYLRAGGQSWWQVLPLTPPARGNSPYSSYSVFAGNPYLIDLQALADEHLLHPDSLCLLPDGAEIADFDWCDAVHMKILRDSFLYAGEKMRASVRRFSLRQSFWLPDYALFMALKNEYGGADYRDWPDSLRLRGGDVLEAAREEYADEIAFWEYVQYLFFSQWRSLKRYANARGIKLIGDMPIYVDSDSADVWANPKVFDLDEELMPRKVAGVPPDAFSAEGQLWGNPLYNWKYLRRNRYSWWVERLRVAASLYDSVRIDHFRAVVNYWAVPVPSKTAKTGVWQKGPGMDFIRTIRRAVPECSLIAEDLGLLDDTVRRMLKKSGLPGMKVLLFAFDPGSESDYLPHRFIKNCVGYIGTHDNDTVQGWLKDADKEEAAFATEYLDIDDRNQAHWKFIRRLYATKAQRVIVQMQDVLGLGSSSRMNKPGVAQGNWTWRLLPGQLSIASAKSLRNLSETYCRFSKNQKK